MYTLLLQSSFGKFFLSIRCCYKIHLMEFRLFAITTPRFLSAINAIISLLPHNQFIIICLLCVRLFKRPILLFRLFHSESTFSRRILSMCSMSGSVLRGSQSDLICSWGLKSLFSSNSINLWEKNIKQTSLCKQCLVWFCVSQAISLGWMYNIRPLSSKVPMPDYR